MQIPEVAIDSKGFPLVIPCGREMATWDTRRVYWEKPDGTTTGNIGNGDVTVVDDADGNTDYALRFLVPDALLDQIGQYLFFPWGTDGADIEVEGRPPARLQVTERG